MNASGLYRFYAKRLEKEVVEGDRPNHIAIVLDGNRRWAKRKLVCLLYTSGNVEITNLLANEIVIGQFVSGMIPFLWIGLGTIFVGILFSNWLNRKLRHISDILRLIVLVALYPTVHQFTNILMYEESSFSLILPLVAGFAVTAASATLLIRRYRKKEAKN